MERLRKECDKHRKKYLDSKQELEKACTEMENYGRILDTLEGNVKRLEVERDQIGRERDSARQEVKIIRTRYANIVGLDQFKKDFPM